MINDLIRNILYPIELLLSSQLSDINDLVMI